MLHLTNLATVPFFCASIFELSELLIFLSRVACLYLSVRKISLVLCTRCWRPLRATVQETQRDLAVSQGFRDSMKCWMTCRAQCNEILHQRRSFPVGKWVNMVNFQYRRVQINDISTFFDDLRCGKGASLTFKVVEFKAAARDHRLTYPPLDFERYLIAFDGRASNPIIQ